MSDRATTPLPPLRRRPEHQARVGPQGAAWQYRSCQGARRRFGGHCTRTTCADKARVAFLLGPRLWMRRLCLCLSCRVCFSALLPHGRARHHLLQRLFISWVALQAVADIIRTTLGPRSMLKMLLDASGGAQPIPNKSSAYSRAVRASCARPARALCAVARGHGC